MVKEGIRLTIKVRQVGNKNKAKNRVLFVMLMKSSLRDVIEASGGSFSIIEEFSELSPRRKVLLCDHLFTEGRQAFYNTIELLWPQSNDDDALELEKFLYSMKYTF